MKPELVRVVVVGTGGIGRHHLNLWKEVPNAEVVGVFDILPKAAQAAAERFKAPKVYATLEEAVADPKTDVVDVCTPNMFHKEGVLAALAAGKHCLCEKPLACTSREVREMIAARDRSGKLLMTTQNMRFEERSLALKQMIAANRLGDIYYGRAWWLRRRLAPTTPGFLHKAQAGLGPGADIGVHVLDLSMHLMGHPKPVSVTGVSAAKLAHRPDVANQWGRFDPQDYEVEDFAAGLIRFESGAALSLEASWLLNMFEDEVISVTLFGTEAGVRWPELKFSHVQDGVLVDSQVVSKLGANGHKGALTAMTEAILGGKPSPVPTEQSLTVIRILEGLYESAAAGREVRLA